MTKKLFVVLIALGLFGGGAVFGQAVVAPYTEGTVWQVSTVHVKYGLEDDYFKSLGASYRKIMDELKKEGVVVSYKILSSQPASKDDWNVMLMVEYKNMAALDGLDPKFRAAVGKAIGNETAQRDLMTKRLEIRELLGEKTAREITLK